MERSNGLLYQIPAQETQRRIDEEATVFVAELQPGWNLYRLSDGAGLLTLPDLVATDDPAFRHGVRMVIGVGEIWESPESVMASLQKEAPSEAASLGKESHILEGIFDTPELVTTGLKDQVLYLAEALNLSSSPPLTIQGLGKYDGLLPKDPDDYDVPLIRAVACVLSEAVRDGVGGVFDIERKSTQSGSVWEPWIRIPGIRDRILPAADYVNAINDGQVVPLTDLCLSLIDSAT